VKRPVMCASKKMLPGEQNYSVGDREALAIMWAVNKFHCNSTDSCMVNISF